ncbi:unnamed protein product [Ambrosiozyma monospora]|uniref:Unnamed protein product n=1 Tax=Ambrosiozyma monospora TaxID=43982 RepID=A0A9W6YSU4_AMBMO|nr:unnamed protein product [Ambrosiozyma monospora]
MEQEQESPQEQTHVGSFSPIVNETTVTSESPKHSSNKLSMSVLATFLPLVNDWVHQHYAILFKEIKSPLGKLRSTSSELIYDSNSPKDSVVVKFTEWLNLLTRTRMTIYHHNIKLLLLNKPSLQNLHMFIGFPFDGLTSADDGSFDELKLVALKQLSYKLSTFMLSELRYQDGLALFPYEADYASEDTFMNTPSLLAKIITGTENWGPSSISTDPTITSDNTVTRKISDDSKELALAVEQISEKLNDVEKLKVLIGSLLADLVNHGFKYSKDLSKQRMVLEISRNLQSGQSIEWQEIQTNVANTLSHYSIDPHMFHNLSASSSSTTTALCRGENSRKRQRTDSLSSSGSSRNASAMVLSSVNSQTIGKKIKVLAKPPQLIPSGPSVPSSSSSSSSSSSRFTNVLASPVKAPTVPSLPSGPSTATHKPVSLNDYLTPSLPKEMVLYFQGNKSITCKQCGIRHRTSIAHPVSLSSTPLKSTSGQLIVVAEPLPSFIEHERIREWFYRHGAKPLAKFLLSYLERHETNAEMKSHYLKRQRTRVQEVGVCPVMTDNGPAVVVAQGDNSIPSIGGSHAVGGTSKPKARGGRLGTGDKIKTERHHTPPVNEEESRQRYEQFFRSLNK